jgi:hypothetical protein
MSMICIHIGEPSFCINRKSWKIESTSFYQKTLQPNEPATKLHATKGPATETLILH